MGLRDHLEDGTGHVLSPGLDLDYLHVDGAERQADLSVSGGAKVASSGSGRGEVGNALDCGGRSSRGSTGSWTFSEESAVSDGEEERLPGRPPEDEAPPPVPADHRAKMEFALKLGYPEELVLLVLRKLGPNALINDVLGELVKLGTKTEVGTSRGAGGGPGGPGGGPGAGAGGGAAGGAAGGPHSPASSSSPDSCRLLRDEKENLRPVVVDGSNVAMSHGNKEVFSCQGIQLAVDWFLERGHRDVTVFVPAWRKEQSRPDALISDQEILRRLEKEKILVFTPSRRVQGRRVVCYDDRFIVKLAYESDGVIVSNDNYRDLANEKPEWKRFIDERLLMYSFVNDKFMPPDDPLGRHGPSLENFLRKRPVIPEHRRQPCPYGKKCTYGHKCKFYHPERGNQPQRSVADELRAKMSTAASRVQLEDVLMSRGGGGGGGRAEAPRKPPSPRSSCGDTPEVQVQPPVEPRRPLHGPPAPGGPPSSGIPDQWDPPGVGWTSGPLRSAAQAGRESPVPRVRSALNLPEFFLPADLRPSASDGSSDGSVCSDTFSPDVPDDGPRCLHHHHHHHQHPPLPPGAAYAHPEEPLRPFVPSYLAPHPPLPGGRLRRSAPLWLEDSLPDSGLYDGSPLPSRRSLPPLLRPPPGWGPWGGGPRPGYDPLAFRSLPELHADSWLPPRGRRPGSAPVPPPPPAPSPRERAFVSLCGIFPPDLVRRVMSRSPHLSDAQELAAAILMEKTQGDA